MGHRYTARSIKGKQRGKSYRTGFDAILFGVKKQQFGRTRSPHGRKMKVQFNKLVYDPIKRQAVTARRFITRY